MLFQKSISFWKTQTMSISSHNRTRYDYNVSSDRNRRLLLKNNTNVCKQRPCEFLGGVCTLLNDATKVLSLPDTCQGYCKHTKTSVLFKQACGRFRLSCNVTTSTSGWVISAVIYKREPYFTCRCSLIGCQFKSGVDVFKLNPGIFSTYFFIFCTINHFTRTSQYWTSEAYVYRIATCFCLV